MQTPLMRVFSVCWSVRSCGIPVIIPAGWKCPVSGKVDISRRPRHVSKVLQIDICLTGAGLQVSTQVASGQGLARSEIYVVFPIAEIRVLL